MRGFVIYKLTYSNLQREDFYAACQRSKEADRSCILTDESTGRRYVRVFVVAEKVVGALNRIAVNMDSIYKRIIRIKNRSGEVEISIQL